MMSHKKKTITASEEDAELCCTYPGCEFTTLSGNRLQFHMGAHLMSKYKCRHCDYGCDSLVGIRRHILRSKAHEGISVYQCQRCDYGSKSERKFRHHLKKYHFSGHIDESALDSMLDELFLNENYKQRISANN